MADEAIPITCFCCGVCCSKYQVQMTINEAHNIADKLGIEWETFEAEYIDNSWPGVRTVLLRHSGGHCVFLEPQPGGKVFFCHIQAFKPRSCIEWNADLNKKDCREGLSYYWNLNANTENGIEGAANDIEAFNSLLTSLDAETDPAK
jgi:Fe-S-cluster containining protein